MSALKEKSITGFIWSFINTGGTQILGLMFGIILARILDPSDFGYIAIIVFFTSLSNVFVDSGFSHALIRDQNSKNIDYSSVFIFSFLVSLFLLHYCIFSLKILLITMMNLYLLIWQKYLHFHQ